MESHVEVCQGNRLGCPMAVRHCCLQHRQAARARISRIRAAHKAAGVLCLDATLASEYEEAGANFIGVGVDTQILAQGANALAARFRAR